MTGQTCLNCANRQIQGDGMTHWYGCERGSEGCEEWRPLGDEALTDRIIADLVHEVQRAESLHPDYPTAWYGFWVILAEVWELFLEVVRPRHNWARIQEEVLHIACVAFRFLKNLCYRRGKRC